MGPLESSLLQMEPKKGRVLAPTLFSIMFSAMLHDAFSKDSTGVGFDLMGVCLT